MYTNIPSTTPRTYSAVGPVITLAATTPTQADQEEAYSDSLSTPCTSKTVHFCDTRDYAPGNFTSITVTLNEGNLVLDATIDLIKNDSTTPSLSCTIASQK